MSAGASHISGTFYPVEGSVRDIKSAVQSNNVERAERKQLADGAETEIETEG